MPSHKLTGSLVVLVGLAALLVVWWPDAGTDDDLPALTPPGAPSSATRADEPTFRGADAPPGHVAPLLDDDLPSHANPAETAPPELDVELLVRFHDGRAAPGARLRWIPRADQAGPSPPVLESSTDAEGRATLRISGRGSLRARDTNSLAGSATLDLEADELRPGQPITLTLIAPGRLHVDVVTHDGLPARDAQVRVFVEPGLRGDTPGLDVRHPTLRGLRPFGSESFPARRDDSGGFVVVADAGVPFSVRATRNGRSADGMLIVLEPGETRSVGLPVPGAFTLTGHVVDDQGEALGSGQVHVWWTAGAVHAAGDGAVREGRRVAHVDEHGAYDVDLPGPGRCQVVARGPLVASALHEVALEPWAPHARVDLVVPAASSIRGHLVDGRGQGLPDVVVRARPAHLRDEDAEERAPSVWTLHGEARATTAADGSFELSPLHPDGTYILYARPDPDDAERKLVLRDVEAGRDDVLLVASEANLARARLSGVVRSGVDGGPVAFIRPTLLIELDGQVVDTWQEPLSTADGHYLIEGLAPGYRYRLRLQAPGLGAVELPWFVASVHGRHDDVTLPMLAGIDLDAKRGSRRLDGGRVVLQRLSEDFDDAPRRESLGEQGRLLLDDLLPGRYRLTVTHPDGLAHTREVDLEPGQTLRVTAPLSPAG